MAETFSEPKKKNNSQQTQAILSDPMRKEPGTGKQGGEISSALSSKIQSERGRGESLSPELHRMAEDKFGQTFEHVKIHKDETADALSGTLNAGAFTVGSDIFLRGGSAEPKTMLHELTHVVQQQSADTSGQLKVGASDTSYEHEAENATQSESVHSPVGTVQRVDDEDEEEVPEVQDAEVEAAQQQPAEENAPEAIGEPELGFEVVDDEPELQENVAGGEEEYADDFEDDNEAEEVEEVPAEENAPEVMGEPELGFEEVDEDAPQAQEDADIGEVEEPEGEAEAQEDIDDFNDREEEEPEAGEDFEQVDAGDAVDFGVEEITTSEEGYPESGKNDLSRAGLVEWKNYYTANNEAMQERIDKIKALGNLDRPGINEAMRTAAKNTLKAKDLMDRKQQQIHQREVYLTSVLRAKSGEEFQSNLEKFRTVYGDDQIDELKERRRTMMMNQAMKKGQSLDEASAKLNEDNGEKKDGEGGVWGGIKSGIGSVAKGIGGFLMNATGLSSYFPTKKDDKEDKKEKSSEEGAAKGGGGNTELAVMVGMLKQQVADLKEQLAGKPAVEKKGAEEEK